MHGVVYADTETADVVSVPNSCIAQFCSTCTYVYVHMLYYILTIMYIITCMTYREISRWALTSIQLQARA